MKLVRWLPFVLGGVLLARRFGPRMGPVWERIFDRMPESFPCKWMYLNITTIREQNERILGLLAGHTRAHEQARVPAESTHEAADER